MATTTTAGAMATAATNSDVASIATSSTSTSSIIATSPLSPLSQLSSSHPLPPTSTSPLGRPPPPPIPRRHPSRPSAPSSPTSWDSASKRDSIASTAAASSTYNQLLNNNDPSSTSSSSSSSLSLPLQEPPLASTQPPSHETTPRPGHSDGARYDRYESYLAAAPEGYDSHAAESSYHMPRVQPTGAPGPSPSGLSGPNSGRPLSPSAPASPGVGRLGQAGLGLGAVGLGPVRIDFKDWVKAGREAREGSVGDDDDNAPSRRLSKRFAHQFAADPSSGGGVQRQQQQQQSPHNDTSSAASTAAASTMQANARTSTNVSDERENGPTTSPLKRHSFARPSGMDSSLASSASMSSPSIDSNHSPRSVLARGASQLSERAMAASDALRASTATPTKRTSTELVRSMSRSSYRSSLPPASPAASTVSQRRLSHQLMARSDSGSALAQPRVDEEGEMETMVSAEYTNPSKLQDRFRDAEETRPSPSRRLSDGPGLTLRRFPAGDPRSEALSTPPHNEIGTPTTPSSSGPPSSRKPGSSGGRIGKVRQPIPLEFQNGSSGLFTPPKTDRDARAQTSQERERERTRFDEYNLSSPRSQRSFATARPQSVLETRSNRPLQGWLAQSANGGSSGAHTRSASRSDFDRFQPIGRLREFPTRNRPESVMGTSADRERYEGAYTPTRSRYDGRLSTHHLSDRARASGDFSSRLRNLDLSDRNPLSPSDSISAVGMRAQDLTPTPPGSGRKDPLEMMRRMEENRAQSNRRWEEDRSMSVLGDRSPSVAAGGYGGRREVLARPASRFDDGVRSSSRMSMVMSTTSHARPGTAAGTAANRDSYYGTPRRDPLPRRRTTSTDDQSATADSPLLGRTSRASGSFSSTHGPDLQPRVTRRSQTSLGTRSTESSYDEVASASEHGRNLVSAAKVLDRKLEFNPEIVSRLAAAASTGERANAGVRAAASIAAELAVDVELDDRTALSAVRDRLPRLAITLREASRSSDQAVRDLTDGLLAIRGVGVGSASTSTRTTPQRRPDSAYAREPATEPSHRRGWSQADTPVRYPRTSTGPGDLHSPATRYSPLAAFGGRETPRQERVRERYDSGASTSSRQERFDGREGRERESRGLDPIEQSPPGRSNRGSPESAARVAALATKDDSLANSLVHPPQPHNSPVLPSPSTAAALQQAMMEEHEASPATSAAASPATTVSPAHPSRKQTSTASTHTVRPHSFAPAQRREPTTALSNSPAYSQAALAHADDVVVAGAHAKRDSAASLSSMLSRDAVPAATAAIVTATATPAMSPATVAAEDDVEHVEERPERERTGTFGSIEGARVRASVSERFRKHLSGEPAE